MREILFRGKRSGIIDHENDGEWTEGGYIEINGKSLIMTGDHRILAVDPSTVGQYTGLTANGKEIFEGDICIVKENGESDYATVGFEHGAFVIYPVNGKITEKTLWDVWYNDFSIEVIGNIHDNFELFNNSELLEDKP